MSEQLISDVAANLPTLGERRVRISFNPNNIGDVHVIKTAAAQFIDLCNALHYHHCKISDERKRLIALAMTAIEEASMWAVKAATLELQADELHIDEVECQPVAPTAA